MTKTHQNLTKINMKTEKPKKSNIKIYKITPTNLII